jgi:hypothetical protein
VRHSADSVAIRRLVQLYGPAEEVRVGAGPAETGRIESSTRTNPDALIG